MASNSSAPRWIPAPVGGVPDSFDRIPSIVFAVSYFLLFIVAVYRLSARTSRTWLLVYTLGTVIERTVVYSLRTESTYNAESRFDDNSVSYIQVTLAISYFNILQDMISIWRVLLVRGTNPPDIIDPLYDHPQPQRHDSKDSVSKDADSLATASECAERSPSWRARRRYRIESFWAQMVFFVLTIPNILAGVWWDTAIEKQSSARLAYVLRQVSGGAVLLGLLIFVAIIIHQRKRCAPEAGAWRLLQVLGLLTIVSVYRLVVMSHKVSDLHFTGDLNSRVHKSLFYLFHAAPEYLAAALLLVPNSRKSFGLGVGGDWRKHDGERPSEMPLWCFCSRKRREEKRAEREARRRTSSTSTTTDSPNPIVLEKQTPWLGAPQTLPVSEPAACWGLFDDLRKNKGACVRVVTGI